MNDVFFDSLDTLALPFWFPKNTVQVQLPVANKPGWVWQNSSIQNCLVRLQQTHVLHLWNIYLHLGNE
jgi:hypothetical protein